MPWLSLPRAVNRLAAIGILIAALAGTCAEAATEAGKKLQLEVHVNETAVQLIAAFTQYPNGRMAAQRSELGEIGIKPVSQGAPEDLVPLDDILGLSYRYDEMAQRIYISVPDAQRIPKHLMVQDHGKFLAAKSPYGMLLNYNLWNAVELDRNPFGSGSSPTSLTLEARAFSPFGALSQTGIVRGAFGRDFEMLRLDSTFEYADQQRMITYRAGDTISGGLPWTRPIRIGGVQAQRDFGLRPDLITMPLPVLSGSAVVPSTVDLYINNIKALSQDVGNGPFTIGNLPVVSGRGTTRLVIRDASGRETVTTSQFYAAPTLLAPDLTNFSLELGFPRLSFGTSADKYTDMFAGSGTLRRGIFDGLTIEGHGEATHRLLNAGVGAVVRVNSLGVAGAAVSTSTFGNEQGHQI